MTIMKKEIADYIEGLLEKESPLTNVQVQKVAYWEFSDFQQGIVAPENWECNAVIKKLLKGIK